MGGDVRSPVCRTLSKLHYPLLVVSAAQFGIYATSFVAVALDPDLIGVSKAEKGMKKAALTVPRPIAAGNSYSSFA